MRPGNADWANGGQPSVLDEARELRCERNEHAHPVARLQRQLTARAEPATTRAAKPPVKLLTARSGAAPPQDRGRPPGRRRKKG